MRRIFGLGVIAALVLAACGGGSNNSSTSPAAGGGSTQKPGGVAVLTVNTEDVSGIGTVLVNAEGHTLYHLKTETASNIQCTGDCATTWPPLLMKGGASPTGGIHVTGDLATITRPDGGVQVTYNGLPLYTYSGDTQPGQANGQGIENVWFAVTPSMQSSAGGGASPTASPYSGYGGY